MQRAGKLGDAEGVGPLDEAGLDALDYVPALWKWDCVLRHLPYNMQRAAAACNVHLRLR